MDSKTQDSQTNFSESIVTRRSGNVQIDNKIAIDDSDLLHQIGYKQEMRREYSTWSLFGIAFSIMGTVPSIATTAALGLECGPAGLVWGWFITGIFILCIGVSLSFLSSSIPTSGGLFYYSSYYSGSKVKAPLSFLIGCSNSMALCSGFCAVINGLAAEIFAMVNLGTGFESTKYQQYGLFLALVLSQLAVCSISTKGTVIFQVFAVFINVLLILLFVIAIPIGTKNNLGGFNDASYIFTKLDNLRDWNTGWSFMLSWMTAIWSIGAFDSCIHMSEECKDPTRKVPTGIIGSITIAWIVGWVVCIVICACIKDGDVEAVLESKTGMVVAQIVYDSLGKKWAIGFMALIAVGQYVVAMALLIALSRQVFSFARDDGLPFVYNYVKVIHPKLKVPVRAIVLSGLFSCILALLVLINSTAANALFSLGVASNFLAWGVPILLVILPTESAKKFVPGPFYSKRFFFPINLISCLWIAFVIILSMFPNSRKVEKDTMNYTIAINGAFWSLSLLYYYVYGYKHYTGPKSNLDSEDEVSCESEREEKSSKRSV